MKYLEEIEPHLRPRDVTDLIFRMDEYISEMRGNPDRAAALAGSLSGYMDVVFHMPIDVIELKNRLVSVVDQIYILLGNAQIRDRFTDAYFSVILQGFFAFVLQQGVLVFFIVDNEIRDDRFRVITELFAKAGFKAVYPYDASGLQYSDQYTPLPVRSLADVEADILEALIQKRHILYTEKDGSVNYLKDVVTTAEKMQSDYVCVFRNEAVDGGGPALRLTGEFAHLIRPKQN